MLDQFLVMILFAMAFSLALCTVDALGRWLTRTLG